MADDGWHEIKLGEFVSLQRGHDLPESQRKQGRVPVLGSFGVTGHHDTAIVKGPGVTVGRSGASFGVVSYTAMGYWPLNTVLYVTDFHGNDERFAYYFLRSIDFTRFNSGSAQPSLNRNYIHPIPVVVPPVPEQRAIAHILGTLDDKIELNRRMNETLEAMARAVFKSWFLDFDPVRAKTCGGNLIMSEFFEKNG
jgi:type I restriction enzyme S subunit